MVAVAAGIQHLAVLTKSISNHDGDFVFVIAVDCNFVFAYCPNVIIGASCCNCIAGTLVKKSYSGAKSTQGILCCILQLKRRTHTLTFHTANQQKPKFEKIKRQPKKGRD